MKLKLLHIIDLLLLPLIWLVDILNTFCNPFEPFIRSTEVKYYETLEEKRQKFEGHLQKFWQGPILNYRLPIGDAGDQCLHHGLYTAMLTMKAVLYGDKIEAIKAAEGLLNHQNPLIRGIQADGTKTGNVSNDQLSGHLLGCYYVFKYIDKDLGACLIDNIATELLTNHECLINENGDVTLYGRLINGFLTDPLNLTLCLAVYKAAFIATGNPVYDARYVELFTTYRHRIAYANLRFLWLGQTSVPLRAAIHYHILNDVAPCPEYEAGMRRLVSMEKNTGSPVLTVLCNGYGMNTEWSKKHLLEYTLEDKAVSNTKINSDSVDTVQWGAYRRVKQPLPRWKVTSQDFFDARHWYSCDDVGTGEEHNGGDWLFGYYGMKFLNLL